MKLFLEYIKAHKKSVIYGIICIGIFLFIFFLYNAQVDMVLYAFLLCLFCLLPMVAYDFSVFVKHHRELERRKKDLIYLTENLPEAKNLLEKDYQELLMQMLDEQNERYLKLEHERSGMVEYYSMWVHQIKTPIAAMHLLLQTEDSPVHTECEMELQKIEQYVEMVLSYVRLESDTTDYMIKQYDLDSIIRQAVRKNAKGFIRKKIRLQYETVDVKVLTDEKWLLFVIEQLLSNALKYTYSGSVSIYMDPEAEKTLVIEDTGIGVAPEDLPRIFENGYTGYNGRKDKKSTGIGLHLCKRILSKLSHQISITSEVGKGTKVYVDLKSAELTVE